MRIIDVEAIILRLPGVLEVCDGTQDALVVRIRTDEVLGATPGDGRVADRVHLEGDGITHPGAGERAAVPRDI